MSTVIKMWNNFKTQPDVWFFFGFLVTFPLTIRKVLFFYPIARQFNEYSGIYLYLSDILLFLLILTWIISILRNKKEFLSNISPYKEILLLILALVIWAFVSISWANNKNVALFRSIKLVEFYLLFAYIIFNVPRGTIIKRFFQIIIFIGLFQAIIGIGQFVLQHSLGLFWLKESLISPSIAGVAKFIFGGHKLIRAYGLFPHPDILGGLLLISMILTWQYCKLFHPGSNVPRRTYYGASVKQWIIRFTPVFIGIQMLGLFLAFCKSAIIGLVIAVIYIPWITVPRGTVIFGRFAKMFHVKQLFRWFILAAVILILFVFIVKPDFNSLFLNSLEERVLYLNVSRETIINNPVIGVGMGQFVLEMQKYSQTFLASWQYQPVHTVFLLIWSELGVVGLILFLLFLWKVFENGKNVPRGTLANPGVEIIFQSLLLAFTFVMLFDHYLWDIQQGQLMLWLVLGLAAGRRD